MPTYEAYKDAIEAEPKDYEIENLFIGVDKEFRADVECVTVEYSFMFDDRKWFSGFTLALDEEVSSKRLRDTVELFVDDARKTLALDKKEGTYLYAPTT